MLSTRRHFVRSLAIGLASVVGAPLLQACSKASGVGAVRQPATPMPSPDKVSAADTPSVSPSPSLSAAALARQVVSVLHCKPEASDDEIQARVAESIDQVIDLHQALKDKRKVFVKVNVGPNLRTHRGRLQEIVDPVVVRGVVAALRRRYSGEILVGESPTTLDRSFAEVFASTGHTAALQDLDVRLVNLNQPPLAEIAVPGGGLMHSRYTLSRELADTDFVVSVAKMKSHLCAGVTLSLKNFFGVPPMRMYGCPRRYLHSLVRLPRVLVDLGLVFRPGLCVIDGLVGQNGSEWDGQPADTEVLVAGNNTVATDAVAARLMGVDPLADYGTAPFYWDRNPIKLAHDAGLGSAKAEDIEVKGDDWSSLPRPQFNVNRGPSPLEDSQRQKIAEQAKAYLAQRDEILKTHRGQIVCFQDGKPAFYLDDASGLSQGYGRKGEFLWGPAGMGTLIKRVLPAEEDAEHMEVYERI